MKPELCLDSNCFGGENCSICIKRNIIALEGYNLIQSIEKIPASIEQTEAINATQLFITIAETALLLKNVESSQILSNKGINRDDAFFLYFEKIHPEHSKDSQFCIDMYNCWNAVFEFQEGNK